MLMKQCPMCHMVVDAYAECPMCGADITNEPQNESEIEGYRINKWFLMHLIRHHKFPLICTLLVLMLVLTAITAFDKWSVLSLVFLILMWVEALYKNLVFKLFGGIYSEGFLEVTHTYSKYAAGVFGILFAFLGRII